VSDKSRAASIRSTITTNSGSSARWAFEAAHDYIAQLVGAKRVGKVVRLQRTNPLDPIKAELLGRLREHYAAGAA
jgi:hypothetical protein